ncbi:MAG: TonB family protein [Pseudomonadota bacterium]
MAQDKTAEIISFNGGAPQLSPDAAVTDANPAGDFGSAPAGGEIADANIEIGVGETLSAARQAAGQSLDAVSDAIKVKTDHLRAIETSRRDQLPSLPYVIGFVKTYARYLGLDAEALAARYKAEARAAAPAAIPAPQAESDVASGEDRAKLASVFAVLVILLFAMWVGFQVLLGGGEEAAAPAAVSATAPGAEPATTAAPAVRVERPSETAMTAAPADAAAPLAENAAETAGEDAPIMDDAAPSPVAVEAPVEEQPISPQAETPAAELSPSDAAAEPNLDAPQASPEAAATTPVESETIADANPRPLPRRAQPAPPADPAPAISPAVLTRSVAPGYPERCARGADQLESVTVMFDVSANGRAVNGRIVSSSNDCFEGEALRTLSRWRFDPRTVDGAPAIDSGKTATLNFRK